ncbi:hypothetical protein PORCRE_312 [Porphyromonas crevioricanis JCM 15906]|uniref:Uncharacterized protein n=1 Tax=Porphyromonas crevioricanis JCM 15906 TaxID=1305617 RepID=T1CLX5_9PORP|nr:hypothetical protein PORCRE_312 [Porphyromonas crevioricanis JCM 15906]GAD07219.1 hypothetical protein PORCAN_838 [Porphyromonas crevioricanis JCM 13913]
MLTQEKKFALTGDIFSSLGSHFYAGWNISKRQLWFTLIYYSLCLFIALSLSGISEIWE